MESERNRALGIIKEAIALWAWRARPMEDIRSAAYNEHIAQGLGAPSKAELDNLVQEAKTEDHELKQKLIAKGLARNLPLGDLEPPKPKRTFHSVFDYDTDPPKPKTTVGHDI